MSKSDVAIIGGGVVGLSCAYYLLKSGRRVTLLEQKQIGAGSSTGNAGHIVPSHIIPLSAPGVIGSAFKWILLDRQNSPFGMKLSLDPAYLAWLLRFAASCTEANVQRAIPVLDALGRLSAGCFAALMAEEEFECNYQQTGLLFLYKSAQGFEAGSREAEVMRRHGVPAEVLDQTAVHQREPATLPDVVGGVHFTGDASLNPALFVKLLGERVQKMGAQIHEDTSVTGFEMSGAKIARVKTSRGEFEPELVVLAAGAWSPNVARGLGLNIPVQPARGYSLTMTRPKAGPRLPLLLGERRVAVTPLGNLLRFTGRLELSQLDTTVNPRWIRAIERAVREFVQLDPLLEVHETWAGLRPTTPDGLPIIGRSPRHSNLLLATGHAMLGLSLGPGTGQIVAQLGGDKKPDFNITPLRLERF
jgi:D-amino-acid dehydrogenase